MSGAGSLLILPSYDAGRFWRHPGGERESMAHHHSCIFWLCSLSLLLSVTLLLSLPSSYLQCGCLIQVHVILEFTPLMDDTHAANTECDNPPVLYDYAQTGENQATNTAIKRRGTTTPTRFFSLNPRNDKTTTEKRMQSKWVA